MHRHKVILKARLAGVSRGATLASPVLDEQTPATPNTPTAQPALLQPSLEAPVLRNLLTELAQLVDNIKAQERQGLGEVAQMSVELAAVIAERLLASAIIANRQRLDRIVLSALERMQTARAVTVRGHAEDLALLERLMAEHADLAPYRDILTFRHDEGCERGQLKVEADDWFIEWDTPRCLAEMRAALLEETFMDE